MNAGGSVRYSRENELCRGITLTSKRGMEAHVTVPKRVNVTATESVYHIDCRAKCEYDIIVETPCTIKYRWGYICKRAGACTQLWVMGFAKVFKDEVAIKNLSGFEHGCI